MVPVKVDKHFVVHHLGYTTSRLPVDPHSNIRLPVLIKVVVHNNIRTPLQSVFHELFNAG